MDAMARDVRTRADTTDVLLHPDLHGANALRHGAGWRVIDPHAVRGDRQADVWVLIDPLAPVPPDSRTAWSRGSVGTPSSTW